MENRIDLLNKKIDEFILIIETTKISLQEEETDSQNIMDSFLENGEICITPPQQTLPIMRMLTIDSINNYKGESVKPGNIKLNIRHVIEHLSDIIENTFELATDIPILKVCAVLNICKMLKNITTIETTKEQALAIIALWENCNQQQHITLEKGFNCFKAFYERIEESDGTWEQYIRIITELEKIGCLRWDTEGLWLCESLNITYDK